MMRIVDEIIRLWNERGGSNYGHEPVTQLEHALQTATLALNEGAEDELVAAALLHDIGHLLHDLDDDAPDRGVDDRHEVLGQRWLERHFGSGVTEPVRLHVAAKRYLCAVEPAYEAGLSEPSRVSLALQGGVMTREEAAEFIASPHAREAVRLRRWDDEAKVAGLKTPILEEFRPQLTAAAEQFARSHREN